MGVRGKRRFPRLVEEGQGTLCSLSPTIAFKEELAPPSYYKEELVPPSTFKVQLAAPSFRKPASAGVLLLPLGDAAA